jgi:type IV pilus assembly protein PilF
MMRLHSAAFAALVLLPLLTACSAFMVPGMKEQRAEYVAPDYHVADDAKTTKRMAAQRRLSLAEQRLNAGDLKTAEAEAAAALKADPASADALTLLAVIADKKGASAQAGDYFKRAAEAAPKQGGALNNYGAWLCGHGFPAESLVWFDRALAAPGYGTPESALANAGGCALKAGQYERADRDLRKALSIAPQNAYALAALAESEYRQGRYFEARAFTERRLAAAPANAAVLQLAAGIEEKLGDKAAASRYVQRLRAEFPDVVTADPWGKTRP